MNIRTKLIVVLSTVLIFSFFGATITSYVVSKRVLKRAATEEILPLMASSIYAEVQWQLLRPIHVSSLMANDTFLKDWVTNGERDTDQVVKYLDEIKQKYGFFSTFFVSDETRNYYYYDGIFKKIDPQDDHDVWYYDFKALNTYYDLDVDVDEITSRTLTVFINHRLQDAAGTFLGVTGVGLKMTEIGALLASYQKQYDRLIFMVNSQGLVQIHPDESLIEKATLTDLLGDGDLAGEILASKEGVGSYTTSYQGRSQFLSTRYFPDFDWYLIIEQDESSALGTVNAVLLFSLLVGIGATCFVVVVTALTVNHFQGRLMVMATTDVMTGLANRRHFMDQAQKECMRAERTKIPFCLLSIDVDSFKRINDEHGHAVGDDALRHLAGLLSSCIREIDILGRVGGEEFAILLPETDMVRAMTVAERIRAAAETGHIATAKGALNMTVSIGVAQSASNGIDMTTLTIHADQALYDAKRCGRNTVRQYGQATP